MRMCGIEAALSYEAENQPDPTDPGRRAKGPSAVSSVTPGRVVTVPKSSPILMQISNMRGRTPRTRAQPLRARAA